ncbi:MAG TPA: choice-of-anchor D domain-containing protein, partial [Polyangiaceae bacterium]
QINVTTTGSQLSWTASLGKGSSSPYVLAQSAGTASSGKPGVVTVTPRVMPATADTTADAFADTLTIVAPDGSHVIPLHETAHGAVLSQSTSSIAFGGVNTGTKATSQLNVVNTGNASATVSYLPSAGTFSVSTQGASVAGQGTSVVSTVTFAPTSTGSFSDTATMKVSSDTVLCADLPKGIALSGTGTQTYASVSPTTLDFGMVNCGATGSKQTVTIKNSASLWSNTFTWTATLGKGSSSPYKLSSTTNQLSGQGTASIDVTPVAIPSVSSTDADYYADTLTITTNALNDTPHIISLHETAQGAILSFNPTSVAFGSVAGGSTATDTFQIVNTGNYPASKVSLALGSNAVFSVSTTSNITVNGGSSTSDTATFKPAKGSTGAKSTTVTPSFSGANCGGTPTPLTLSGTGT